MDIRVLRYFLAVVDAGTINGAALQLHISQPTLSRQLIDLEDTLGVKLFTRGNRRIALTEEGSFLYKRAQEIVDLCEKTESELLLSNDHVSGSIYIGGGESDGMRLVAREIKHFQSKFPKVSYHLYSGNAEDVTLLLDKGLLDFGILIEPVDVSKYDCLRLPSSDLWGLLMNTNCPLAAKSKIVASDLLDLPLIISRQTLVSSMFSKWLGSDLVRLNIVSTYNLLYNASLLVEEELGYALALDNIINTSSISPLCFRPLSPELSVGLFIVWKKNQAFSKAAELFLKQLSSGLNP